MFLRIKRVKGHEYAYLVENKWNGKEKKEAKQKVKRYLGRVFSYNIENNIDFFEFVKSGEPSSYLENKDYEQVLNDLITWEFNKHGITDDILVHYNRCKVQKDGRDVCIRLNDGLLCGLTLKRIWRFEGKGSEPEVGKRLAKALVEAGINVPQDVFVGLFEKVFEGE